MNNRRFSPEGESLSKAVRWLGEHRPVTRERIDEAARRFDLSPLEADFLLREYLRNGG